MHLTNEDLTGYRDHRLSPEQILRIRQHADDCADCRGQLAAGSMDAAVLRALFSEEPDEQELVLFVAGRLPEDRAREIEAHAAHCGQCSETIEELREFAPRAAVKAPLVVMPVRKRAVWLQFGALAAALLIAAVAVGGLLRHRPSAPLLLASLHDGSALDTLSASGEVGGLPNLDAQERGWIGDALRSGRLPAAASLATGRTAVLRGNTDSETFRLIGPVNRRVMDDRPEFQWEALPGASTYEVTVFTEEEKIVAQGVAKATEWRPEIALPRGVRLSWQVAGQRGAARVIAPAPPVAPVFFELIPAEQVARIERARGGSHLELAVLYASAGLVEEAQGELAALEAANTGSRLVKQMRESLAAR